MNYKLLGSGLSALALVGTVAFLSYSATEAPSAGANTHAHTAHHAR